MFVARTTLATIQRSVATLNSIAELRRAKETADFFDSLVLSEQTEWLNDLIDRTSFNGGPDAPHVCLLDTGVNRGHPLIAPALATNDLHTVEPGWGTHDADGHGTEMAGLAIAGNLTDVLDGADRLEVHHRLESVKLLLITYQAHLARSTAWIAPWGACNGRRIGPNGLHDAMSVARIRFPCRCGARNMRFVRNQETT